MRLNSCRWGPIEGLQPLFSHQGEGVLAHLLFLDHLWRNRGKILAGALRVGATHPLLEKYI